MCDVSGQTVVAQRYDVEKCSKVNLVLIWKFLVQTWKLCAILWALMWIALPSLFYIFVLSIFQDSYFLLVSWSSLVEAAF